jgi:hypothetical protein
MDIKLILFFLYMVAVVYLINFGLANKSTPTNIKEVYMYSGTLAMTGIISEVLINSFCRAAFDAPLWLYQVTPIRQGDTSVFAFFQWALYGYHLYFVRKKLQSYHFHYEDAIFALVLSVDALLLEILINISSNAFLDTFVFYYLPGDFGHLTTVYVYPVYLLGGVALCEFLRRFEKDPLFFGNLSFSIAFVIVFL